MKSVERVCDLRTVVDNDAEVNILTFDSDAGSMRPEHTCSHVLAEAVKNLLIRCQDWTFYR